MRYARILCTALLLLAAVGAVSAGDPTTLEGSFLWKDKDITGDLKAVFTETGANTYDVAFHFMWEEKPRVWEGTAEGNLNKGKLSGTILDEKKENTFSFSGKAKRGVFKGTHFSHRGEEPREMGTLTLEQ